MALIDKLIVFYCERVLCFIEAFSYIILALALVSMYDVWKKLLFNLNVVDLDCVVLSD